MTMQVTNPVSPVTAAARVSAAHPADSAKTAFASLLRQSRSAQAAPTEVAPPDADPAAADEAAAADAPAAPNTPFKTRIKLADKATAPRPAEHSTQAAESGEPTHEAPAADQAESASAKRNDAPLADPAPAPWLALPQPPPINEATAARGQAAPESAAGVTGDAVAAGSAACAKADETLATQDKAASDTQARLETATASQAALAPWTHTTRADSTATQRSGQPAAEDARSLKPVVIDTTAGAAALGAATFNPLLGSSRDSAAPLSLKLATPLASPEFAQALGVQMSVLASDGVQRAELQLNPAEMGPVSVQIVIDGTSARVDFGADLAATRRAIEAGLPELAGALRDAGFTLTGGGVSQHSGGRSGAPDTPGNTGRDSASHRSADAGSGLAQAAPQRRAITAGGVDLYA